MTVKRNTLISNLLVTEVLTMLSCWSVILASEGAPSGHPSVDTVQLVEVLMKGHTDRKEELQILSILSSVDAETFSYLFEHLNLRALFSDVDDRLFGPDNKEALFQIIKDRIADLTTKARLEIINALQIGLTDYAGEELIVAILEATNTRQLTLLKNMIDAGGDYHDLQQLIFTDVDDLQLRERALRHILSEGRKVTALVPNLKVLSDIDDTFYCSYKDQRYPKGTIYPGVLALYQSLSGSSASVSFLTARPKIRFMAPMETLTHKMLTDSGSKTPVVLSGAFQNLIGQERIADKKFENFVEYQKLFPEYNFVFIGDSGQADALFGLRARRSYPGVVKLVLINDVVNTPAVQRSSFAGEGVHFFDTYIDAAGVALEKDLIDFNQFIEISTAAMNELNQIQFSSSRQKEVMFTLHRNALERVKQNYDLNIKERLQEAATHSFV